MSSPQVSPHVLTIFNQYWPEFSKSKEYQGLNLPHEVSSIAPTIIQQYLNSMNDRTGLTLSEWTVSDMKRSAKALIADAPKNHLGVTVAAASLLMIQQFLKWLATTGALRVPQSTIKVLLLPMMLKLITFHKLHHRNH
ncbi:hypothetical protein LACPH_002708 [Lacticaseibacillus parahuelsenbergensis]|uniref:Uncharacterized protein n=1 Tax=Lacticaseibacillus parahuelsenbergensis TaxID=3068305 RepID=A0ABY9L3D8_9LACO|nr:hypothetical protein [Lacticaseibacillus sp. NCIMB 15471]WLV77925.1 hypothetical protein LACPH_002708 [Lacticaseibacillus sp. NCIMB 15471]